MPRDMTGKVPERISPIRLWQSSARAAWAGVKRLRSSVTLPPFSYLRNDAIDAHRPLLASAVISRRPVASS
jgi:hypothetical protein